MEVVRRRVGAVTLTRVPWIEIPIEPSAIGLDPESIRGQAIDPAWVTEDGHVHFAQCAWVIESSSTRIVVDPAAATDEFLRTGSDAVGHQTAFVAAMEAADQPVSSVDVVALTHLDGIGMIASTDGNGAWWPTFPSARIAISTAEIASLQEGGERSDVVAFDRLRSDHAVVDVVATPHAITPEVTMVAAPGHTPGHCVIDVRSEGARAVFVGHLPVTPVHAIVGCDDLNADAAAANQMMTEIFDGARADGALVIGSLWPHPGIASVDHERMLLPAY
jgi:glyoxylase-like metal-dependent hydrolase (beta-lactamase superfamily II)